MNFKINSRPLFIIIFKLKNDNFKTRDFSPLIERGPAGVTATYAHSMKRIVLDDLHTFMSQAFAFYKKRADVVGELFGFMMLTYISQHEMYFTN